MPTARIPVSGGRVNSRDPSLLRVGELRTAQDAYYKPNDLAIWKIDGRAEFNAAAESAALRGGAWLEFDNAANLFVVMHGTRYRKATAGLTGSFSDLAGFDASNYNLAGTATTLDVTHYANEHVLMNGVDRNRVVRQDATQMFHSMRAATNPPSIGLSGTGLTLSSGKTLKYWVEERVKIGSAIIKRSASSSATVATLTGPVTNLKPTLTRPPLNNPDATHWALMGTATDGVFPVGAEIGEVAIATLTIDDTRTGTDPGLPTGTAYETVSATIGGTVFTVPKNGPAPTASTGDIFEDSLITNDTADESQVVFSVDDNIHAVPSINKFRIGDTKRRDKVVAIRSLDNVCAILGRDSVYRINTLPRPSDTTFSAERVKAKVHFAHGCSSPMAAALFSFGEGLRLAYVSPYGVLVTDTAEWDVVTDDVDWEGEVEMSRADQFVLINNPRFYRLELYYVSKGSTRPDRAMFLHYHPTHGKATEGSTRAKVTWPVRRDANAAFIARISGVDETFTCNENGKVYLSDTGTSEPVIDGGIQFKIETGEAYLDDVGGEARLRNLYVHHQAHPGQVGDAFFIERNPGQPDHTVREENIALDLREATPTGREGGPSEAHIFGFENSDTLGPVGIDYFVATFDSVGPSKEP